MMKIAAWNVNSLKVRLPSLLSWIKAVKPDVMALQETKLIDNDFPLNEIQALGYHVYFTGQKAYNGVAILTRLPANEVLLQMPTFADEQRRFLALTLDNVRIVNVYVPNGSEVGSEKYEYKLLWLKQLREFLKEQLTKYSQVVVLGDFNIAPTDQDVHDPKLWHEVVLTSTAERHALRDIMGLGLHDVYREKNPQGNEYSWWDYRAGAFRRNNGLRIDLILATAPLLAECGKCWIDKTVRAEERPSDHGVVVAE